MKIALLSSKILGLLALTSLLHECQSAETDYSELKYVYTDLAEVLKTKDDSLLMDFCYRLAPDETTLEYMRENNMCYRGIPCRMDRQGYKSDYIGEQFFRNLKRFRESLSYQNRLENLTHLDTTIYRSDLDLINGIPISGTEAAAVFQSGDVLVYYDIGEMILINNKWSLFTRPASQGDVRPLPSGQAFH